MKTQRSVRIATLAAGFMLLASSMYAQSKVVVSHDEWFTGNGFFNNGSYDNRAFINNTLNWFGVSSGKVLIYSNNAFLTGSELGGYLTGTRGLSVTYNASELATNFSQYAAILVGGNTGMDAGGLANYVLGGGNVFVEGGTGAWGSSAAEAGANNLFLNAVGLGFNGNFNGLGTVNTSSFAGQGPFGAALFTGINSVYANNGNDVLYASSVAGVTDQVWNYGNDGVFGAAEVSNSNVTPEPATLLLLGTGLIGLGLVAFLRRVA